jgi:hypothetical protein
MARGGAKTPCVRSRAPRGLPKLGVAGSNPVRRSLKLSKSLFSLSFLPLSLCRPYPRLAACGFGWRLLDALPLAGTTWAGEPRMSASDHVAAAKTGELNLRTW